MYLNSFKNIHNCLITHFTYLYLDVIRMLQKRTSLPERKEKYINSKIILKFLLIRHKI